MQIRENGLCNICLVDCSNYVKICIVLCYLSTCFYYILSAATLIGISIKDKIPLNYMILEVGA